MRWNLGSLDIKPGSLDGLIRVEKRAAMTDNEKTVGNAERDGRNGEEVHLGIFIVLFLSLTELI
jgi:hypothetical protein